MKNAKFIFRNGDSFLTQIDDEKHHPSDLGGRMSGGFVVCSDARWGKPRTLVINLADVQCIVIED